MNVFLASLAAGIGALLLVMGAYAWINRRRLFSEQLVRSRLGGFGGQDAASAPILRKEVESQSVLDKILSGRTLAATVENEARRGGLNWSAGQFAAYVIVGILVGLFSSVWLDWMLAFVVGVAGALSPLLIVTRRRRKRERMIEQQLPDAVDMLVNSMKAGFSLQAGMSFVGQELPAPVGPEFARFYDEQRLGIDVRQALESLQDRLGTLDARMLVLAILIQRETGGNLGEILTGISKVIRERINFRDQLNVLTAESKLSAVILALLPVALFVIIRLSNPEYIAQLTDTSMGRMLLIYAGSSLVVGFLLLQRMARIEV